MNLVDEQHIVLLQRCQDACQVAWLVEHRATGNLEAHAQLVGNDVRQRCLAQSWGTVQQRVVQRLTTILGSLDEHLQILHNLLLAAEVTEAQRSQGVFKLFLSV